MGSGHCCGFPLLFVAIIRAQTSLSPLLRSVMVPAQRSRRCIRIVVSVSVQANLGFATSMYNTIEPGHSRINISPSPLGHCTILSSQDTLAQASLTHTIILLPHTRTPHEEPLPQKIRTSQRRWRLAGFDRFSTAKCDAELLVRVWQCSTWISSDILFMS